MHNWTEIEKIDFDDRKIHQYHVDTRDFCVSTSTDVFGESLYNVDMFSAEEVKNRLIEIKEKTGGSCEWRMLDGNFKLAMNWGLKYIRIYRWGGELFVCNNYKKTLSREDFYSEIKSAFDN